MIPLAGESGDDGIHRLVSYLPMAHVAGRYTPEIDDLYS